MPKHEGLINVTTSRDIGGERGQLKVVGGSGRTRLLVYPPPFPGYTPDYSGL